MTLTNKEKHWLKNLLSYTREELIGSVIEDLRNGAETSVDIDMKVMQMDILLKKLNK